MKSRRGFSLIEVLLATTLLAAGLALAFATLRSATVATERAESVAQRSERLRAVQAFLRRQLQNAMPLPYEFDPATGDAKVFEADANRLRLVAPMPGYLSRGGPYVQTFTLVPGVGGRRLEFEHQLLTPDGPIDSEREPEILLEGIADGAFGLRGFDDLGEPGPWTSDWDTPAELPRLVRLQLRMVDERSHWPALVASPRVGLSPTPVATGLPVQVPPPAGDER